MTADNVTERARQIVTGAMFGLTTPTMVDAIVSDLADAGLLVTPEHDAAVAVKTLREAAGDMDDTDDPDAIHVNNGDIDKWLRARADRIKPRSG